MNLHHQVALAADAYQIIRDRIRAAEVDIDEQTLADTLEGVTNVHELISEVVRSALIDEALAEGLKGHVALLQERLVRLLERADKKRAIARDVMDELGLHKIAGPDFTLSLRLGQPAVVVVDEAAIPRQYFVAREPRLDRLAILSALKRGVAVTGVSLSEPDRVLSVRVR